MTENRLTHLKQLEAESIHIIREVAAEFENPVMLYSIGKDSAVMLHLALKAFYPAKLPFPLLHVDTGWKFKDMITFRDNMAKTHGFDLIVHQNKEGRDAGINPFDHGSSKYTDIMKTQGLKQALINISLMLRLVVHVVMKKNHVRKNVFIHSVIRNTVGIQKPTSRTLESLQR
jgi:sulfate adenylyltransferase subunit 2